MYRNHIYICIICIPNKEKAQFNVKLVLLFLVSKIKNINFTICFKNIYEYMIYLRMATQYINIKKYIAF